MALPRDGKFQIKPMPIIGQYGRQRFAQWGSEDTANFYIVSDETGKRPHAMYPCLGRKHINDLGYNQLIFAAEPREIFKTINYIYVVVGNQIYQYDKNYVQVDITASTPLNSLATPIYFSYLVANNIVFACFVDDQNIYIYREDTGVFTIVTDPNSPGVAAGTKPGFIVTFGNRIAVSVADSSQFFLSQVNLGGSAFDPATCFTIAGAAVFAQETGIIRQMGVLNNTLYIFTDFTTGNWANRAAVFPGFDPPVYFPWSKNTTYDWNFGIANPTSLDIDFGYMVFLAQNSDGLLQFMATTGDIPEKMSSKSIDTLLQRYTNALGSNSPFLVRNSNGFIYQYENSIFYRMSGGAYDGNQILDQTLTDNSIEFCFENKEWHRCIENNGERNRVKYHIFFNQLHLVSVVGDKTIYNLSGQYYFNEITNPNQPNVQETDAYVAYPMRYERITPIVSEPDYSEFETEYVEIDFVFGDSDINYSTAPFSGVQFIIDEVPATDGSPQYMIAENPGADGQPVFMITDGSSDSPSLTDTTYNYLFNPHIELWFSDDGGISFQSADVREFAQMGVYQWKMRWYQLGPSRNRVYKLICVSIVPIVVLGGVMNVRRMSGGAN